MRFRSLPCLQVTTYSVSLSVNGVGGKVDRKTLPRPAKAGMAARAAEASAGVEAGAEAGAEGAEEAVDMPGEEWNEQWSGTCVG